MVKKYVYSFSANMSEGSKEMKNLLGGKGANLAEMSKLELPVPPGMTISTDACLLYQSENSLESIKKEILDSLKKLEIETGKTLGGIEKPLLLSVRSGARVSMPGMMDTVLNLGLNDEVTKALAKATGNERFAWDSYRRFIQMFANVVMGMNSSLLESTLEDLKDACSVTEDTDLEADDLKELVEVYKRIILEESGEDFPVDPYIQLWKAIEAVFESWNNPRAIKYRQINKIPGEWGTAVNIQSMVFGNTGKDSATGVCFTRNPSTGENEIFGEYLVNAQGEDVVAGIRTPSPINNYSQNDSNKDHQTLSKLMPTLYKDLEKICEKLEAHYKDMQDIEFTIEDGKLFLLQTRNGKRTASSALKIACDLVKEKLISKKEAILKVSPEDLNQLLHPGLDENAESEQVGKGLPASPGAASGQICFTSEEAESLKDRGIDALLVRQETSPEDISGMVASNGILTCRGGMTSHAAVVARGMGKPCVVGCSAMEIDLSNEKIFFGKKSYERGDFLTIDGGSGKVFEGIVPTTSAKLGGDFVEFMSWADENRRLKVRANADSAHDGKISLEMGAEGIGLCRTEHMFFDADRINVVREMIFSENIEERESALIKLLPMQRKDFYEIFMKMNGLPVNIRLLDPPLHEFLPHTQKDIESLAVEIGVSSSKIEGKIERAKEFNPMLGHRGCRLGISHPEIYMMQVRAIVEAALKAKEDGAEVIPEIMIPLISTVKELEILKEQSESLIKEIFNEKGRSVDYKIGTMIELPRAAITASEVSKVAQFFSFGTNDLTQTTLGLSRDDAGKFLPDYIREKIYNEDPFVSIDIEGVGFLVEHAVKEGRRTNEKLHCGVCGEHGGDEKSVEFFHKIGLDYVSCSPYRVPIARLAAAQVNIREGI